MATPVGHSLVALAIYRRWAGAVPGRRRPGRLLLTLALANAPDVDFLPGILVGAPALYHQGPSHSIMVAIVASVAAATLAAVRMRDAWQPLLWLFFLAYTSHLVVDVVGPDRRPPFGVPLAWPLSHTHVISPVPLLLGVHHATSTGDTTAVWLANLMHPYNIAAIMLEIAIFLPFVFLAARAATPRHPTLVS